MDLYAKNEKALRQLHDEIVEDIKTVLKEKGYTSGRVSARVADSHEFEILSDRLLLDGSHTDNISADYLLWYLRDAYRVLPKFN